MVVIGNICFARRQGLPLHCMSTITQRHPLLGQHIVLSWSSLLTVCLVFEILSASAMTTRKTVHDRALPPQHLTRTALVTEGLPVCPKSKSRSLSESMAGALTRTSFPRSRRFGSRENRIILNVLNAFDSSRLGDVMSAAQDPSALLNSTSLFEEHRRTSVSSDNSIDLVDISIEAYIAFFLCSFLCAAALQWLISHITVYNIPVSIIWFIFGMSLAGTVAWMHTNILSSPLEAPLLARGIAYIGKMNAEVVYLIFLPILLYEACLNIDWHKFKKFAYSGISLAVFGVGYQVAIVGFLVQVTFGDTASNQWSNAFLFGSAMASTDPVAVISVLNSLQAPGKLASMFEGEALINDGSSMLLFQFFKSLSRGDVETWQGIVAKFILLLGLGPIWGYACGVLVYIWVRRFRRYPDMQVLTWISGAYAVYFIGERYLHTSGPIAIVCYGLFYIAFGHIGLDNETQHQHHHSVQAVASLANSSVFVIAGVVAARMIIEAVTASDGLDAELVWNIPVLYLYLLLARASMVLLFLPILKRTGYGVNWKEVVLLVWGGLRGAIVLAMGLMIEQDHKILSITRYRAVLYIAGNAFLILLVNGVTFELMFKLLNPYPPKPFRRVYLERVMKMYATEKKVLEEHWLFRGTHVLKYADRAVPVLGWRRMNSRGKIDFKLPSLYAVFRGLPSCDSWVPPTMPLGTTDILSTTTTTEHCPSAPAKGDAIGLSLTIAATTAAGTDTRKPTPSRNHTMPTLLTRKTSVPFSEARSLETPQKTNIYVSPANTLAAMDAQQRGHSAAASVLGLRDAREEEGCFDAKYYLRLLEHVTEPVNRSANLAEQPRDSIRGEIPAQPTLQSSEPPGNIAAVSLGEGALRRSNTIELERLNTDETIVFCHACQEPLRPAHELSLDALCASQDTSNDSTRSRRTTPIHVPSADVASQATALERGQGANLNLSREPELPSFSTSQMHSAIHETPAICNVPQGACQSAAFSLQYASHTGGAEPFFPRISSEPFDSSRFDCARMTRLRRPEWDNRQLLDPYNHFYRRPSLRGDKSCREGLTCLATHTLPSPSAEDDWSTYDDKEVTCPSKRPAHSADVPRIPIAVQRHAVYRHSKELKGSGSKTPCFTSKTGGDLTPRTRRSRSCGRTKQPFRSSFADRFLKRAVTKHDDGSCVPSGEGVHHTLSHKATLSVSGALSMPDRVCSAPEGRLTLNRCDVSDKDDGSVSSIDSSEEYLAIPETPRRGSQPVALVKVLRKEREGELYIMAFNAIRQMYRRLYEQRFIGGAAMLSLNAVLDVSTDFAIGKLKKNPIKAWRDVLENTAHHDPADDGVEVTEDMTGFEFEWRALACRLHCVSRTKTIPWRTCHLKDYPWLEVALTYQHAVVDLQLITAFVDVHEELLWKGGLSLEELLGQRLLSSYKRQVFEAKHFIVFLRESFPRGFPYALTVHAATLLINLKQMLIEEQAQKGLILQEDCESLLHLFEEQHQNLASFRPFKWKRSWLRCLTLWPRKVCDDAVLGAHQEMLPKLQSGQPCEDVHSTGTTKDSSSMSFAERQPTDRMLFCHTTPKIASSSSAFHEYSAALHRLV